MALAVETEDLGIAAGPQDRFVQAHEGLLYMDFAEPARAASALDPALAAAAVPAPTPPTPPSRRRPCTATCAGASTRASSGRARCWRGSPSSPSAGATALLAGRGAELGELMTRNFELRARAARPRAAPPADDRARPRARCRGELRRLRRGDRRRRARTTSGSTRFAPRSPPRAASSPRRLARRAVFSAGRRSLLWARGESRAGQRRCPETGPGGAGVQLQALPRGDAAPSSRRTCSRARSGSRASDPVRARAARRAAARPPERPRPRLRRPVRGVASRCVAGAAVDRTARRGGARHPAPAREGQRAVDRAAHRARGRVPRRCPTTRGSAASS